MLHPIFTLLLFSNKCCLLGGTKESVLARHNHILGANWLECVACFSHRSLPGMERTAASELPTSKNLRILPRSRQTSAPTCMLRTKLPANMELQLHKSRKNITPLGMKTRQELPTGVPQLMACIPQTFPTEMQTRHFLTVRKTPQVCICTYNMQTKQNRLHLLALGQQSTTCIEVSNHAMEQGEKEAPHPRTRRRPRFPTFTIKCVLQMFCKGYSGWKRSSICILWVT